MPELHVHHRDPLSRHEEPPESTVLRIDQRLPADGGDVKALLEADAVVLAHALWEALPGGTVDRLVAELLRLRSSLLRVGYLSVDDLRVLDDWRAGRLAQVGPPGATGTPQAHRGVPPVGARASVPGEATGEHVD